MRVKFGKLFTILQKNKKIVRRFFFTTAYKIKNWKIRTHLLMQWRNITSKYANYGVIVYDENNFYSDQVSNSHMKI